MKSHNDLLEIYCDIQTINNLSKYLTNNQKKQILTNLPENDILILDKFLKAFNKNVHKMKEFK